MRQFKIHAKTVRQFHLDLEHALNEQQRAAVCAGEGPKLVIAGAGSGKTRTITYRVAYLILQGLLPQNIMLATFTNKAAREMLRRVDQLIGAGSSKVWGGTFHSIANRILRQNARIVGYSENYSILDEEDQKDLIKLCVTDIHVKTEKERFPSAAVLKNIISFSFNTQLTIDRVMQDIYPHFVQWTEEIKKVERRYQRRKKQANCMDYDDLLRYCMVLCSEYKDVLEKYGSLFRYILVDEYQDTNRIQADIVELLASRNGHNLMVVGDDSQSIYAFRGANYDNILKFPERNPGTEIFKLEINYRSTPQILHFTNESISHNTRQYEKHLQAVNEDGVLPCLVPVKDIYQEAAFTCERILELREEGVPLEEIAVLYRAHAHSMVLQAELIKANIPYEIRSGLRFFEQAHIKDVLAHLKVLENPFDEAAWRRLFLMIPRIGNMTADKLWRKIAGATDPLQTFFGSEALDKDISHSAMGFWKRFRNDFRFIHELLHKGEHPSLLIASILETGYMNYLKARYDNYTSRIEDINQLAIFAKQYSGIKDLLSELVLLGELYGQDVVMGAEPDKEKIILSTVHQAKGLEWESVFLIRMGEGSFPAPMALRQEYGEEEERRIFYVATTRAKRELYLSYPVIEHDYRDTLGKIVQPSRFIQEIGPSLYERAEVEELEQEPEEEWGGMRRSARSLSDEVYYSSDNSL
ncbi:MAG: ATP-dependent helicase [Candidatus Omnitrophica bacterium]|nr:ATP-dependent helicase [Candidatus Omnitrophota bacterium]